MEYLGDAVLQLITAEYLYKYRPAANEGELTQTRSAMVNTNTLASLSEELGVGEHLYLGKGIAKGGGRSLRSLLANAFEAILGAVFLDAGYDAAYHYYLDRFRRLPEPVKDENHKGRLQQVVQERFNQTPFYDSAGARGTGQHREYTAVVFAGAEALGTGHGPTKQEAEQDAARQALARLTGDRRSEPAPAGTRPPRTAAPRTRRSRAVATPAPAAAVTPSEVAEILVEEETAVEAIQPDLQPAPAAETQDPETQAAETPAAEAPVAAPAASRPRRRRSPARSAAPVAEPVEPAALPDSPTAHAPADASTEAPLTGAPRRRRPPRRAAPAGAAPAQEPQPAEALAPTPALPAPSEPPAPASGAPPPFAPPVPAAPAPPRSRQFGQPLDE